MKSPHWQLLPPVSTPHRTLATDTKKEPFGSFFFEMIISDQLVLENLAIDIKVTALPVNLLALPAGMSFWKPAV